VSPLRVLILDDRPTVAGALRDLAAGLGHRAASASTLEDAHAHDPLEFDVLLCHLNLEGQPGVQILSWARERNPRIALGLMTGEARPDPATPRWVGAESPPLLFKPISRRVLSAFLAECAPDAS